MKKPPSSVKISPFDTEAQAYRVYEKSDLAPPPTPNFESSNTNHVDNRDLSSGFAEKDAPHNWVIDKGTAIVRLNRRFHDAKPDQGQLSSSAQIDVHGVGETDNNVPGHGIGVLEIWLSWRFSRRPNTFSTIFIGILYRRP